MKTKNSKLNINKLISNKTFLYTVFALFCLNLGYFIINEDTESLILFTIIGLVVYLINNNIILTLLIPIVCVNILNWMKKGLNTVNNEGFINYENKEDIALQDKIFIMTWIKDNISNGEYTDYEIYTDPLQDGVKPLSLIIENIKFANIDGENTNADSVDELLDYLNIAMKLQGEEKDTRIDEINYTIRLFQSISDSKAAEEQMADEEVDVTDEDDDAMNEETEEVQTSQDETDGAVDETDGAVDETDGAVDETV